MQGAGQRNVKEEGGNVDRTKGKGQVEMGEEGRQRVGGTERCTYPVCA
jgi:hypothetical protein